MLDIFLDALIDSLKVFGFSFIIYVILSFFEEKIIHILEKEKKYSPILGATVGLIPQCGVSVVAADLYTKKHITIGTLFAVFFACSDEALPILFSTKESIIYVIPLLLIKFVFGFVIGYLIDYFFSKSKEEKQDLDIIHIGGCHHDLDHSTILFEHFIHPLLHSIKIFIYVFVVNIIFGMTIFWIGEENLISFLSNSKYISPIVCGLVGLIPNCASSVLISELFILGDGIIPFGALVTGLSVNAGLGIVYLIKNKKNIKDVLFLISTLFICSIIVGYIIILIMNLF